MKNTYTDWYEMNTKIIDQDKEENDRIHKNMIFQNFKRMKDK